LVALGLFFAQGNPILPPPVPAPNVTVENRITVEAPKPDPQVIAESSVESSKAILISVVAPPPVQFATELLKLPDLWRTTPPELTYNNPAVRQLAEGMRLVAFALLALAIFAVGAGRALGQDVSLGRVVFAAILSAGNLAFWEIGVRLNNAICAAIGAPDLPSFIRPHLSLVLRADEAIGSLVLTIVYAIVAIMLLFSLLFRLGFLEVFIAIGSLALMLYATPQTEHFASAYTRLSSGMLLGQVLVVLGLRLAEVLSGVGTGIGGTLLGIVMLLLIRQLPGLLASSGSRGGGSVLGRLALLSMVRRAVLRF